MDELTYGNKDEKRREEKGIKWEICEDGEMRRGREERDEKRERRGREEILAFLKRSLVRISILQIEQMRAGEM